MDLLERALLRCRGLAMVSQMCVSLNLDGLEIFEERRWGVQVLVWVG